MRLIDDCTRRAAGCALSGASRFPVAVDTGAVLADADSRVCNLEGSAIVTPFVAAVAGPVALGVIAGTGRCAGGMVTTGAAGVALDSGTVAALALLGCVELEGILSATAAAMESAPFS